MTALLITVAILAAALALTVIALLRSRRAETDARTALAAAERDMAALQAQSDARAAAADSRLTQEREAHAALLAQVRQDADNRLAQARDDADARLAELRRVHDEQLRHERETLSERFKSLATDVLNLNSEQLDRRSRDSLEALLAPMRTSLDVFTKNFRDAYDIENRERLSVREQLQALAELNRRVSDEAGKLNQALRGNKEFQGKWGEMVLRNILEASGLEQGRCLTLQAASTDDEGAAMRPDAIITCPDDRRIIIDSKAPLNSYLRYIAATDDRERDEHLKAHVRAVERHVAMLRDKDYQTRLGLEAADFVLLFIPHEGAYIACMDAKPEMWMHAFDSHVIIVSPTHLVTVIKLVEQMWNNSDRNTNAAAIARDAGRLLDKLNGFLKDLASVQDSLDRARASYDAALSKLSTGRGSVLSRADRMRRLGAKAGPLPDRFRDLIDDDTDLLAIDDPENKE